MPLKPTPNIINSISRLLSFFIVSNPFSSDTTPINRNKTIKVEKKSELLVAELQSLKLDLEKYIGSEKMTIASILTAITIVPSTKITAYSLFVVPSFIIFACSKDTELVEAIVEALTDNPTLPMLLATYLSMRSTYTGYRKVIDHFYPYGFANVEYRQAKKDIAKLKGDYQADPAKIKAKLTKAKKVFQDRLYRKVPFFSLLLFLIANTLHEISSSHHRKDTTLHAFLGLVRWFFVMGFVIPPVYMVICHLFEKYRNWNVEDIKPKVIQYFDTNFKLSHHQRNWHAAGDIFDNMVLSINIPENDAPLIKNGIKANLHDYYTELAEFCLESGYDILLTESVFSINFSDAYNLCANETVLTIRQQFENYHRQCHEQQQQRREAGRQKFGLGTSVFPRPRPSVTSRRYMQSVDSNFNFEPTSVDKPVDRTNFMQEFGFLYSAEAQLTQINPFLPKRINVDNLPDDIYFFIRFRDDFFSTPLAEENRKALIDVINNGTVIPRRVTQNKCGAVGIKFSHETYQPGNNGSQAISDIKLKLKSNVRAFGRLYIWYNKEYLPYESVSQDVKGKAMRHRLYVIDGCAYGH